MTSIYNPQQLEPDENTFITALAFATGSGVLTATRNDGVEITQSLDGRYVTSNDYVTSASFNTSDGVLTLTRTDTGTVTVDLDGRYIETDIYVNAASFDASTRVLTLTLTDSSTVTVTIPESPDANTFVTSASFNTTDGVLTLTRNDTGTVTVDLDGRYSTQNTHLNAASFDNGTRILTLAMVNPSSNITVTIPDANDYVNAASFNTSDGVLTLTRTDTGTVTVDLDGRYSTTDIYLTAAAFNSSNGELTLTRSDAGTVVVDLDGRYPTENTHLNSASFDSGTRDLSLVMTDPSSTITVNIPESSDAGTYVNAASFNSSTGDLKLTRTDSVAITANLDGRYVPYNLIIPTGTYNLNSYVNTGIYSVDTTATNIPSDLPSWADELTLQVWEAGGNNGVQTLYTTNGTISVQIGRIYWRMWSVSGTTVFSSWRKIAVENEYQPLYLTHNYYTGDLNDLTDSGIYYIHPTSTNNRPTPLLSQGSTVEVIRIFQSSSSAAFGIKQICRENTFSTSSPKIERGRTYEREWNSSGTWSDWVLVTKGGIPGDLKSLYFAANLNSSTYTDTTGMWSLAASYPLSGWPENFPAGSDYNVLETVRTHTSGAGGYQKLYCADYDTATTHVREFKRTIQSGLQGDWFEYCLQGSPIYKEVLAPTVWTSSIGNNPDTEYVTLYVFDGSSTSASIYGFSNGYADGQKIRFMRSTNSTTKTLTFYHNSYYATQPIYTTDSKTLTLTGYQSVEFIFYSNIWFQQGL